MKQRLKAILSLILSILCIFTFACSNTKAQDNSTLTMYVGLGNTSGDYYAALKEAIKKNTGVDVQYVYTNTLDTTNSIESAIQNYDLPADIVITAIKSPSTAQQNAFLDLAAYTNIPDLFNVSKIKDVSIDGSVYQIPFTTRLIGIQYNKTLLKELGLDVPKNLNDMIEAKKVCEAAGYSIAVSGGAATGHGFNYLFHLMGSQYLSSPNGDLWLKKFLIGESSIDEFKEEASYFEKYKEEGLFGYVYDKDWSASSIYTKTRALFYYNILNDVYSYYGFRYTSDGKIYGASYDETGNVKAKEDSNGNAVLVGTEYVAYNKDDAKQKDLPRYQIDGAAIINDEYASMPWISENGSSNCFTSYDCMYVALDKKLSSDNQKNKLDQAIKVLTFMASEEASSIFTNLFRDGYVGTSNFDIDKTRLYYDTKEYVEGGYLMPWYYNDFNVDSIVYVGEKVNNYIKDENGTSIDDVINELRVQNKLYLEKESDDYVEISDEFSFENCAALQAAANAVSLQKALDKEGIKEQITASIIPYTEDISILPIFTKLGVVQEKIYKGKLNLTEIKKLISSKSQKPIAVRLSGSEIKEFVKNGFNIEEDYKESIVFPYKLITKNNQNLNDNASYIVAIPRESMPTSTYNKLKEQGKILVSNGSELTGDTEVGLKSLLAGRKTLSPKDTVW